MHRDGSLLFLHQKLKRSEALKLQETEAVTCSYIYSPSTLEGGDGVGSEVGRDWSLRDQTGSLRDSPPDKAAC